MIVDLPEPLSPTKATDEFELWCRVGENEVRINTNFIQLKSEHLVRNGVEVK